MTLASPVFEDNGQIPEKYTCDGENVNPPLAFEDVPGNTESLALIVDDVDNAGGFTHWMLWNIDPLTEVIEEDETPPDAEEGMNDFGEAGYGGPCPPSGAHHYRFRAYALDEHLTIPANTSKEELLRIISDHTIDQDELIGEYGETADKTITTDELANDEDET